MATIPKKDIEDAIGDKPLNGEQIGKALSDLIKQKGKNETVSMPIIVPRLMGKESINDAIANTAETIFGLTPTRMTHSFPTGAEEVYLYTNRDLTEYITLVRTQNGAYQLKRSD